MRMHSWLCIALAAACLLGLSACGAESGAATPATQLTQATTEISTAEPTETTMEISTVKSTESPTQAVAAQPGATFMEWFPIGMQAQDFVAALLEHGILIDDPLASDPAYYDHFVEQGIPTPPHDGRRYWDANSDFSYQTENYGHTAGLNFTFFSEAGGLSEVIVRERGCTTPEGVGLGDSRAKVESIYSLQTVSMPPDELPNFVKLNDCWLHFSFDKSGMVTSWDYGVEGSWEPRC